MPKTLCDALVMLGTGAAISALIGVLVSGLVEYWPQWKDLPPKWKRPVILAFCLVVPLGAVAARYALCGLAVDQDVLYLAAMAGLMAFATSQFAHIPKLK